MKRLSMAMVLVAVVTFGIGLNPAFAQHDHEQGHGDEGAGQAHAGANAHGGAVTMSKEFHVETVFLPDQIRLYLYDGKQNPTHVKHWKKGLVEATGQVQFSGRGRGTASLQFAHAVPGGYACPMCPGQESNKPAKCGMCEMKLAKQDVPDGTLWSCPMHPGENGKSSGRCADCRMKLTPQDYLVAMVDLKGLSAGGAKVSIDLTNLPGAKERSLKFTEQFMASHEGQGDKEASGQHKGQGDGHEGHNH